MNIKRLFRFFPPPTYMTMPYSGISFTDHGVRVIGFKEKRGKAIVSHFAFEPLAPGIIKNGRIEKPDDLVAVLKKLKSRYHIRFAAGSIPDEKAYIFTSVIPVREGISLPDVVAFKVQENVPIATSDSVFDFTIVRQTPQSVEVVVRVVHQKVISLYQNAFEAAGIHPLLLKTESQAIVDAVLVPTEEEPHIIIHIESSKTICILAERRAAEFSIVLDTVGTPLMVAALAKTFAVSPAEAELLMKGLGTVKKTPEEILFAIANVISVLRDEVLRLCEYRTSKEGREKPVQLLLISGVPASLQGLTDYFEKGTGLKTSVANVWQNVLTPAERIPPIPLPEALDYVKTVGLALPGKFHF